MKNYRIHSLCVGLFVVVSAMAAAQEPPIEPTKILAEPYQVSMFKNGIGLLHLTAELPDNSGGTYLIHPVPKATLGSFWVAVPKGCKLRDVKITKTRTQETVHAASLAEMLEANIGKTVYLKIDDIWQELTIKEIPEQHEKPVIQPRNDNIIPPPPPPKQGSLVIVDDDGYERAIPLDVIKEMRIKEGKLNREIELPKDEEAIQLTVDFSQSQANEKPVVSLISLSRGVAWSPSYVVDISEEKEASFTAKCVVVNDLMPFKDTKIELIAGFPHIKFNDVDSAFSLTPLEQIMQQITSDSNRRRGGRGDIMAQRAITSNRMMLGAGMGMDASIAPTSPSQPVMGQKAEDLFFYTVEPMTLKKGERGYQVLFNGDVPYEHIYTWDIPNYIDQNYRHRGNQEEKPVQEVWHSLKLTNTTGNPWTTAPAVTMKHNRILGQDIVHFTPEKASTELKITQAVSVSAEQNEYEIERQRNAASFYNSRYDLVTVKGELMVTNYKTEPVTIKISKTLSGEVVRVDNDPRVLRLAEGLRRVNPTSQVVWSEKVKPGKENQLKLEYTFKVYVRG